MARCDGFQPKRSVLKTVNFITILLIEEVFSATAKDITAIVGSITGIDAAATETIVGSITDIEL